MTAQYIPRVVEPVIDEVMAEVAAIALDGPKAVGKTATARRRAHTVFTLDKARVREAFGNATDPLGSAPAPILLDEWQYAPEVWNEVRRAVDDGAEPGRFILAGSAAPPGAAIHSGAGRIARVRLRPFSLAERGLARPVVSLAEALNGSLGLVEGATSVSFEDYAQEIAASGFPGIRPLSARVRRGQLEGYVDGIVHKEFAEQGLRVRRPDTLRRWLRALAAATATTAGYSAILDAASAGEANKPAASTTIAYRDVLSSLWMLDQVPAWDPAGTSIKRLAQTPKHFLADPAFAALLLGLDEETLTAGPPEPLFGPAYGSIAGRLFEALVALSLQAYATACGAKVSYLRTRDGSHEVDFIVQRGRRIVAVEVKLTRGVDDATVRHLTWLRERLGPALTEAMVITTGPDAYRRKSDGVIVLPAALLGP
ncbi:MAG: DUF4143 domain-containing protein [Bifidobacteriaceae bacterium]|nr:DUF4143 domain-containing protein [Bifidobacteriaceae bacterium]